MKKTTKGNPWWFGNRSFIFTETEHDLDAYHDGDHLNPNNLPCETVKATPNKRCYHQGDFEKIIEDISKNTHWIRRPA